MYYTSHFIGSGFIQKIRLLKVVDTVEKDKVSESKTVETLLT
jgi:hypothetical protein